MAAGKKLLVADDSLTIQKVIRLALSNEGYEIQAISDGADAIQQISLFRPDLILVDVSLPTLSAFEIKRQVNTMEDFSNTRFILMSSAFEKIDENQAKEVSFHGRLTKPFDPAHLRQVLQDVLNIPATPATARKTTSTNTKMPAPVAPPSSFPTGLELDMPSSMPDSSGIRLDPPSGFPEPMSSAEIEEEELTPPPLPDQSGFIPRHDAHNDAHSGSHNAIDEIKHLTESTIRMSGLDDFDWTVNDSGLKPPSSLADDGGTSFQVRDKVEKPTERMPEFFEAPPHLPSRPHTPQSHASFNSPGSSSGSSSGPSVSAHEVEEMVRRQVQLGLEAALENMARKILPEVAERIIKAEIHKLLNEKP
jgi:two-component system cell cycle response regulator